MSAAAAQRRLGPDYCERATLADGTWIVVPIGALAERFILRFARMLDREPPRAR